MAQIALRNPQFKSILIPSGVLSVSLDITVNSVLIYRIVKNVQQGETASFDIAEISRDYLNITYASGYGAQTVSISTVITKYSGANATGTIVGSAVNSSDVGFEAYGTFLEGVNPTLPFGDSVPAFLLAKDYANDKWQIFIPVGESGKVAYIYDGGQGNLVATSAYTSSNTSLNIGGAALVINRIDCTKYGIGTKVIFINKFGIQQDLWFFLKNAKKINRTSTDYSSNTLVLSGSSTSYGLKNASKKIFNTQAKQSQTLSSGYYPEFAVEYFEQLLLSEYVWIERTIETSGSTTTITQVPVIVKTSNIDIKTSVNDRLIQYSIQFEDAFDYINNIR